MTRGTPADLAHLEARLRQTGHWTDQTAMSETDARRLLYERIEGLDWKAAREDALPFVRDARSIESWGSELFREAAEKIEFE